MKLSNVKLVFRREMRDQLRDRRTLFTIGVIPLLLYPLMGMAMLQMAQFMQKTPTKVLVVGAENVPKESRFLAEGTLNEKYRSDENQDLMEFEVLNSNSRWGQVIALQLKQESNGKQGSRKLRKLMRREGIDLLVQISPPSAKSDDPFSIQLFGNSSSDKSKLAIARFNEILFRWESEQIEDKLAAHDMSLQQFKSTPKVMHDMADKSMMRATFWAKVLPFVIMIWSLDWCILSSHRFVCRRKRTRNTGNSVVLTGKTFGNRCRQNPDDDVVQYDDVDSEFIEYGIYWIVRCQAFRRRVQSGRRHWTATSVGNFLVDPRIDPDLGAVQCFGDCRGCFCAK